VWGRNLVESTSSDAGRFSGGMPKLQSNFAHVRPHEDAQTIGERSREPNRRPTIGQSSKIGKNLIRDFAKSQNSKITK
jgi:hypothetical protein